MEVVRTYLERMQPPRPSEAGAPAGARLERLSACPPSFYRYLYTEVGRAHRWVDRQSWSDDEIARHLACPEVSLYLLSFDGAPAGYFELVRHPDVSVELAYFGLLPEFLGRGLGRYLLQAATRQAFADGARRVWLHTCSLDHPAALPNYLARGFTPFRQETYTVEA